MSIHIKKVHAFRRLMGLLVKLNIITFEEYSALRKRSNNINSSSLSDKFFCD